MAKTCKAPDAAWQTIKYITSREANLDRITAALAPPTRTDAFDPWLDAVLPKTIFKTKAQLEEVTTGYLAANQNSWSQSAVKSGKLAVPINDLKVSLLSGKGTAATLRRRQTRSPGLWGNSTGARGTRAAARRRPCAYAV